MQIHWSRLTRIIFLAGALPLPALAQNATPAAQPPSPATPPAANPAKRAISQFRVVLDPAAHGTPFNGRLYVVLAKQETPEPRVVMGEWFGGPEVLAVDAVNGAPGLPITIGRGALAFPADFDKIEPGTYTVQAVARCSTDSPNPGRGAGDLYSEAIQITFDPRAGDGVDALNVGTTELKLSKTVVERPFVETDRVKLVEIVSPSLSAFYGRPVKVRAGVCLPVGWKDEESQHYPTLYFINGFGGDHFTAQNVPRMMGKGADNVLVVVPDPSCFLGHSVFADSANNGPRGKALVDELIPEIERKFHGSGDASKRYVTGISSGGWGSLWLQVAYPDSFNGVWSHCPDPVDFRDFQRINLYADGSNMYKDEKGQRRPLARQVMPNQPDQPFLWYDDFVRQETVLGPGGQIHSFEAVFSPRGADGNPVPLFDRQTGAVNVNTAKAWEKYDIRLVLERNWDTLGPKLKGKLHVFAGERDTFYLDGAARLLFDSLHTLGSDAETMIVPGMAHSIYRKGMESMFAAINPKPASEVEAKPQTQPAGAK